MEQVIRIAALCVVGALLALVIKRGASELALLLAVGCTVTVMAALATPLSEIMMFLEELGEQSGVSRRLFEPVYKTVGIAFVVKLGRALCSDAGESVMAAVVESAGTICALLVALPLLREVLALILEFM